MKVALDLQPCQKKRSGVTVYTCEIAKKMKNREGLEFCGHLYDFVGRHNNSDNLKGIEIPLKVNRLIPYRPYRIMWNILPIPYKMLFPGSADLTVFFNYLVPPCITGKVITTIHDLTYIRFPETVKSVTLRSLRMGMQYSIERSDHILADSEFIKKEIIDLLHIPEEKISVLYCASCISETGADWQEIEKKWKLKKPYILYVGTIEPRKNLARLIKAFSILKHEKNIPHQLVLAGGKGWNNEEIYQTAEGVNDIIFTGYISEEEKVSLYKNAEAFVFPSLYEGFGIPPLEAMTCGCPVVCADAASLPEVVGEAARLVDPLDEADIARGIWQVLSDGDYRSRMIAEGYRQAEKFSWESSAQKLTDICARVLNEP